MILRWRGATRQPVNLEGLLPSTVAGLSSGDLGRRAVPVGNAEARLAELFEIEPSSTSSSLVLEGDLRHCRGIGKGMTEGRLEVKGSAGAYAGAGMKGGWLEIQGDALEWAGAEMSGGRLRVKGNVGNGLGAALPGSRHGMKGGEILVVGNAGDDAGAKMRRGLIAVAGNAGETVGRGMIAGSVFVFGRVGRFPGVGMKRGTIAVFGPETPVLPPGLIGTGSHQFPFLAIYLKQLAGWGIPMPGVLSTRCARYNGDTTEGGHGEVLVSVVTPERQSPP